jgi:hypothetical protein
MPEFWKPYLADPVALFEDKGPHIVLSSYWVIPILSTTRLAHYV